jgi:xanthine dehydrogenase YagR molybdenum-binding subunit
VTVDPATGEVRVRRLLGMFAIGRVINPLTARSQLIDGMITGLSIALHEEGIRDPASGRHVNADFATYHIAAHADVPGVEADFVPDHGPDIPMGIKGAGEIGTVGTAAAIANAVWHATGFRQESKMSSNRQTRRRLGAGPGLCAVATVALGSPAF